MWNSSKTSSTPLSTLPYIVVGHLAISTEITPMTARSLRLPDDRLSAQPIVQTNPAPNNIVVGYLAISTESAPYLSPSSPQMATATPPSGREGDRVSGGRRMRYNKFAHIALSCDIFSAPNNIVVGYLAISTEITPMTARSLRLPDDRLSAQPIVQTNPAPNNIVVGHLAISTESAPMTVCGVTPPILRGGV